MNIVRGVKGVEDPRGLVVGLEAERGRLLGIGVMVRFDHENGQVTVRSPVEGEVKIVRVGSIRLDDHGNEIESPSS